MPDEITFIDLACLLRIGQDTTLEKLGSAINASIFDASNIAGALKQKGLIDFTAYYPGPNTITVTDPGKALIAEAEAKSGEKFDNLDDEVLKQLSGGKRMPIDMQNTLNIRPKDLALRIYKLYKQGFVIYELKSGGSEIMLTESGFLKAKATAAPAQNPITSKPSQQPQMPPQDDISPEAAAQTMNPYGSNNATIRQDMPRAQKKTSALMYVMLAVILIAVIIGVLYHFNYVNFNSIHIG